MKLLNKDKIKCVGGDRIDGEEELAAQDWRVRAGHRNKPTQKEREEHEANTRTILRLVCTWHHGKRPHSSPRHKTKKRGSVEKAHHRHG